MNTVETKLAEISSMRLFVTAGTVSGSIEREEIAAAQKQLDEWGVTADEVASELERRGRLKRHTPSPQPRASIPAPLKGDEQ